MIISEEYSISVGCDFPGCTRTEKVTASGRTRAFEMIRLKKWHIDKKISEQIRCPDHRYKHKDSYLARRNSDG